MRGKGEFMKGSGQNWLPLSFWKIAHQRIWDLRCLQVIYSRITAKVKRFENQMIGSVLKPASGFSHLSDLFFGRGRKQGERYA
jgi:hypothetical protein